VYGERTRPLLEIFEKNNVSICDATKKDCETALSDILSRDYGGESRQAFALTLLRLVHYAKKR
jgi:microcystin-dependent protein